MKGLWNINNLTAYGLILRNASSRRDSGEYRLIKKTIQSFEYHLNRFKKISGKESYLPQNNCSTLLTDAIMEFYNVPKKTISSMTKEDITYQSAIGLEMLISEFHEAENERKIGIIDKSQAESIISFIKILSDKIEKH